MIADDTFTDFPYCIYYNPDKVGFGRPFLWCINHCHGAFDASHGFSSKEYFLFENAEDALLFAMKWGIT